MDIVNFFETLAGKWFSQRTVHDLSLQKSRAGQSDLEIDWLTKDHGDVMALCSQANVDAASALGGLRVGQNSLMEGDTQRYSASTLMVVL
ncbi:MAG: phycobiliprotein lyase, partial [Cyanobacteria bacterium P01_H01_bin.119]